MSLHHLEVYIAWLRQELPIAQATVRQARSNLVALGRASSFHTEAWVAITTSATRVSRPTGRRASIEAEHGGARGWGISATYMA